jgi:hypothetical protein
MREWSAVDYSSHWLKLGFFRVFYFDCYLTCDLAQAFFSGYTGIEIRDV